MALGAADLVRTSRLHPDQRLPLVVEPAVEGVDVLAWARGHRHWINRELLGAGAILFRGFGVRSAEEFHRVVCAVADDPLPYHERSSPRTDVRPGIFTSTDYPPEAEIFPHNEHSYAQTFPLKLFFFCERPAERGGRTPIGDTRAVLGRIRADVRERFARDGWLYVRTLTPGLGLSWQVAFQTDDRRAVEEYCRRAAIEYEWLPGDRLRTRQRRPATCVHPRTSQPVWFNHATFFHTTTLPGDVRARLLASYPEEEFPNRTSYGDGAAIDEATADHLRQAYLAEMVSFDWQPGDVLLIDNVLTFHAREAFEGPRRVLVAMADPYTRPDTHVP